MSYTLQNPLAYFPLPTKSSAAGLCKLYVGLIDTDPLTPANQVQVYAVQPDGSELAIPQPIQLSAGGVPQYNGSPVQLKITADVVSVKVTTSIGALVSYTPRWSAEVSAAALAAADSTVLVGGVEAGDLAKLSPESVTPEMFGAVGDMTTDDTAAVVNWFNSGKPLILNRLATYRLTSEINLPAHQIIVHGLGRFPVYPYEFPWYTQADKLPTFLVDHDGSDAFRFRQNGSARGSLFTGFNVIRAPGKLCTRAFGFDVSGVVTSGPNYGYDCTFRRVGVFDFTSAFDMYIGTTSIEPTMADITVDDCCINRNGWIMRNLNNTAWNMLRFTNNKAGQQITGGLDVRAHSVIENGNLLEGMPNPVKISGAYEGCNLGASYFEANTGSALYNLQSLRGPYDIKPCTILSASTSTLVLCSNASEANSPYQVVGEACYNATFPNLDGTVNSIPEIDTSSFGLSYCSKVESRFLTTPPSVKTNAILRAAVGIERGISPINGQAMVIDSFVTSATSENRTVNIVAAAGDYIVLSFMIKHTAAPAAKTYVTVDINGSMAAGSRDYDFGDEDLHIRKGDWKLYTVAVRAQAAVTSVTLRLRPYGLPAVAGLNVEFSGISAYSCSTVNSVRPYIQLASTNSVTSAPVTGTWSVGDILVNATPAAGGQSTFAYTGTAWVYG